MNYTFTVFAVEFFAIVVSRSLKFGAECCQQMALKRIDLFGKFELSVWGMDAGVVRDWLIKDDDVNNHDQSPRFHCAANGAVF